MNQSTRSLIGGSLAALLLWGVAEPHAFAAATFYEQSIRPRSLAVEAGAEVGGVPFNLTGSAGGVAMFGGSTNTFTSGVLRGVVVGQSYVNIGQSIRFGSVIPLPDTDAAGTKLTASQQATYWRPRPFHPREVLDYEWDADNAAVKARVSGAQTIRWRRAEAEAAKPADFDSAPENYLYEGGYYFRIYRHDHGSFNRDDVIPPPNVDIDGSTLTEQQRGDYWVEMPHDLRRTEPYYHSEANDKVYASQAGPVAIIWQRLSGQSTQPANFSDPDNDGLDLVNGWVRDGNTYYQLVTRNYLVSGTTDSTPRRIYWTKNGFSGNPVAISDGPVASLKVAYNQQIPERVSEAEALGNRLEGNSEPAFTATLQLQVQGEQKLLHAFNREGRVLIELLDEQGQQVGTEIVDVRRRAIPDNVTVELGDRVLPFAGANGNAGLEPQLERVQISSRVYVHPSENGQSEIYAAGITSGSDDVRFFWHGRDDLGVSWPEYYVRYRFVWPTDPGRYSHYLRPLDREEQKATAIALPNSQAPSVQFTDDQNGTSSHLAADGTFYTVVTASQPVHRCLLRFIAGSSVRFERVFSWLDSALTDSRSVDFFNQAGSPALSQVLHDNGKFGSSDTAIADLEQRYSDLNGVQQVYVDGANAYFSTRGNAAGTSGNGFTIVGAVDGKTTAISGGEKSDGDADAGGNIFGNLDHATALAVSGDIMLIGATGDDAITVVDVADPASPRLLFEAVDAAGGFPADSLDDVRRIQVKDGLAYCVSTADNSVTIFEFSRTAAPVHRATIRDGDPGFDHLDGPIDLFLDDNLLYVAAQDDDAVTVINVSDPAAPSFERVFVDGVDGFDRLNGASAVHFADGHLYVAAKDDDAVTVIRRTGWEKVTTISRSGTGYTGLDGPVALDFANDALFVVSVNSSALTIINCSAPSEPRQLTVVGNGVGQFERLGGLNDVFVKGNHAYVTSPTENAVTVISLTSLVNTRQSHANLVGVDLDIYDAATESYHFDDSQSVPRTITATATVGERLMPPEGEPDLPGRVEYQESGTAPRGDAFSVSAYVDPFESGFTNALNGSIIPVNAVAGYDKLRVWWFRESALTDEERATGFEPARWPAVIADYTVGWPTSPKEIVLADNQGSGPLTELEAAGRVYLQNNRALVGFNPNEEHALMVGGRVYAIRDDLNVDSGATPTSRPYVLLEYTAADGRPSMNVYQVLREKRGEGRRFEYGLIAPTVIAPPKPLDSLEVLADPAAGSSDRDNLATEITVSVTSDGDPLTASERDATETNRFNLSIASTSGFDLAETYLVFDPNNPLGTNYYFQPDAIVNGKIQGDLSDQPIAPVSALEADAQSVRVPAKFLEGIAADALVTLISSTGDEAIGLEVESVSVDASGTTLHLPDISTSLAGRTWHHVVWLNRSLAGAELAGWRLLNVEATLLAEGGPSTGAGFTHDDRKGTVWMYRGPHSSSSAKVFGVKYYYRTLPGFYLPGNESGSGGIVTPYLRAANAAGDNFVGAPTERTGQALPLFYGAAWPANPPVMNRGYTLTEAGFGLPAVRGRTSLQVRYQQSQQASPAAVSVRLHDPTRDKTFAISTNLARFAPSAETSLYRGKTYFPQLPPHLSERFFYDPNLGEHGSLVLRGQFIPETVGENYLRPNVLSAADINRLKALVAEGTESKDDWDDAIDAMATEMVNPIEGQNNTRPTLSQLSEVVNDDVAVDSYALTAVGPGTGHVVLVAGDGAGGDPTEPVTMHVLKVDADLHRGELKIIESSNPLAEKLTLRHVVDLAGEEGNYVFQWRKADTPGQPTFDPDADNPGSAWVARSGEGVRLVLGESGDIESLKDLWVTARYGRGDSAGNVTTWSRWTSPVVAEGWIKRVLNGINPFNQRVEDLFNNTANTTAGILQQAGKRWEGDVALNQDTINERGLIEIYETVLNRGRSLSIDSNAGPDEGASKALLLAAGYLNDLYMMLGNEAFADAVNPTIGIGTAGHTYSDIATSMFAFRGQVATLLEEELGLLRGRHNGPEPGVQIRPVYNRMWWNFTKGIDAGEVIYALNYNITEDEDQGVDGTIDAADAAKMYPQGHGDAYGHYLTALKGYYHLLIDEDFIWNPRAETRNVLGKPISVDYLDERKFAAAASARARTGLQVFDLSWRQDYLAGGTNGWSHFTTTEDKVRDGETTTRYWAVDHWASRTGQGAYLDWVVGNSMLPESDTVNEGIEKIDRSTVPELGELAGTLNDLQVQMDRANAGANPLGLSEDSIPFDINPHTGFGTGGQTHFEQVYERAIAALRNAETAFDDAKNITRLMRSEEDSASGFQAGVAKQELAYTNQLIEIYGTPYPEDIGPNGIYKTGYEGPDLLHFMYVDSDEVETPYLTNTSYKIDIQLYPEDWTTDSDSGPDNDHKTTFDFVKRAINSDQEAYNTTKEKDADNRFKYFVSYNLDEHGFSKPDDFTGKRASPGQLQGAISDIVKARAAAHGALENHAAAKYALDRSIEVYNALLAKKAKVKGLKTDLYAAEIVLETAKLAHLIYEQHSKIGKELYRNVFDTAMQGFSGNTIVGTANGGDLAAPLRGAVASGILTGKGVLSKVDFVKNIAFAAYEFGLDQADRRISFIDIPALESAQDKREAVFDLDMALGDVQVSVIPLNRAIQSLQDAQERYRALLAKGERLQREREVFRQRSAAVVQGFRTRDAAFRIFRNEKLERYKSLFDLAAQFTFMAAKSYDYETGLLHTEEGRRIIERIINSRALGVIHGGVPQFAGSNAGDPGLSSVLAEMKADWEVLRGRLGFNNPDTYGTTFSLRLENYRIHPGSQGTNNWRAVLRAGLTNNVLNDPDVARYCMQISRGEGLPVPGIILDFDTTITLGQNFFGEQLGAGDHMFSPASFANKIWSVGIALEGYRGMDDLNANSASTGGNSPADPSIPFLDPTALSATPYLYLVPVGVDGMRSPPLGDTSVVRTWKVEDVTIPLPFNIGGSEFSSDPFFRSNDSLTEPMFAIRKHQPFRPVSDASLFSDDNARLFASTHTNTRLVGRSVWNTKWKLVIPGHYLLNDPNEGLKRFIDTVSDIKLHLETYHYSGN